jgi:hypothetical protein
MTLRSAVGAVMSKIYMDKDSFYRKHPMETNMYIKMVRLLTGSRLHNVKESAGLLE